MATHTQDPFVDFEAVTDLPPDATELVFGVNVFQVEAEVKASPQGMTTEGLVAKYLAGLNLPADVVVYVDGKRHAMTDAVPATAKRVELIKPSGEKGASLSTTPTIALEDKDSVRIRVLRRDTVHYTTIVEEFLGEMDRVLLTHVELKGLEVLTWGNTLVRVGRRSTVTKVTRNGYAVVSDIRRRATGGVAQTRPLSINDLRGEYSDAVEFRLNGEKCADGYYRDLAAGDVIEVYLTGETRTDDFESWKAWVTLLATMAYTAVSDQHHKEFTARRTELQAEPWVSIRTLAKNTWAIVTGGRGRTKEALIEEILEKEFPEIPAEDEFVKAWLAEHAPEVLES